MSGADLTGGGPGQPDVACDKLVINTMLSSPKADVVDKLRPGLMLDVMFNEEQTALVVLFQGQIAGGLTTPLLPKLRTCMVSGTRYQAKVVAMNMAMVRLQVFANL